MYAYVCVCAKRTVCTRVQYLLPLNTSCKRLIAIRIILPDFRRPLLYTCNRVRGLPRGKRTCAAAAAASSEYISTEERLPSISALIIRGIWCARKLPA